MKQTVKLIFAFLLLSYKLFGQYSEMVFGSSAKTDKALKEVWEYKVDMRDSALTSKEFYSGGLIKSKQIFFWDTLRKEVFFKYDDENLLSLVTEYSKDANGKDTAKFVIWYLYDQYRNPYFEKRGDSVPYGDFNMETRQQFFTSYIYEDSLIMYENSLDEIPGKGFGMQSKKFEYNDKKQRTKIYNHRMGDSVGYYRLSEELFYDQFGNHIKSVFPCNDYAIDGGGDKMQQPCESNYVNYTYNSKQQLTEEFRYYHNMPFTNSNYQKNTIKYNYDDKGRLVSVLHTMEQDRIYITNRYFKY